MENFTPSCEKLFLQRAREGVFVDQDCRKELFENEGLGQDQVIRIARGKGKLTGLGHPAARRIVEAEHGLGDLEFHGLALAGGKGDLWESLPTKGIASGSYPGFCRGPVTSASLSRKYMAFNCTS